MYPHFLKLVFPQFEFMAPCISIPILVHLRPIMAQHIFSKLLGTVIQLVIKGKIK